MKKHIILKIENISKTYPGVQALDGLNLEIFDGEIHGIIGENGAGKSTFFKILDGITKADSGDIFLNNKKIIIDSPRCAILHGIAMVHQELGLIPNLSVAEYIFLGNEPNKAGWIDLNQIKKETRKLLDKFHIKIDPDIKIKDLQMVQKQIIAICKAVSCNPTILVLDEPTVSLNEDQVDDLLDLLKNMNKYGITILYVSHRLREIFQITDRITVLRDGKKIGTLETSIAKEDEIINMMVGRSLNQELTETDKMIGEKILSVDKLTSTKYFRDISFELRKGEILGIAGLLGCFKEQLIEALFGIGEVSSGRIVLYDQEIKLNSPMDAIRNGIGYVPSDRNTEGLILTYPVKDNINLCNISNLRLAKFFFNHKLQSVITKRLIKEIVIKVNSINDLVLNLSGGNKQKVLIAKWLACNLPIIILNDPTVGIDVGAKFEISMRIKELAREGLSFILVSSELPVLIGLSDRIIVMNKGQITSSFLKGEFDQEKIIKEAIKKL